MVTYTIYRVTTIPPHEYEGAQIGEYEALVECGMSTSYGPKRALTDWFAALPLEHQAAMNGAAKFIVIPVANHHEFQPSVESQPRLVY